MQKSGREENEAAAGSSGPQKREQEEKVTDNAEGKEGAADRRTVRRLLIRDRKDMGGGLFPHGAGTDRRRMRREEDN